MSRSSTEHRLRRHVISSEEAPLLVLMCGLSFSGKSTLARALAPSLHADIVSLDDINANRGLHGGQGISGEEWMRTHRLAEQDVRRHLALGRHVILDDTGSPRFVRDRWRDIARTAGARFGIVWLDVDESLQSRRLAANREARRRPDVTDEVMAEHRRTFEPPHGEDAIRVDAGLSVPVETVDTVLSALSGR
ncbi:AAA family ATPase [Microbacterium sp. NPDC087589]|uniref:AAA family ATPase n=1 Tax=Microbacterium sp. NPDC087589 TaxID=3364191 RepID=UPI003820D657